MSAVAFTTACLRIPSIVLAGYLEIKVHEKKLSIDNCELAAAAVHADVPGDAVSTLYFSGEACSLACANSDRRRQRDADVSCELRANVRVIALRAFSSEVATGSREENASTQESRASVLIQSEPKL